MQTITTKATIWLLAFALLTLVAGGAARAADQGENMTTQTDNAADMVKVTLVVGETRIPAVLNHSKSAQALLAKLPYTVQVFKSAHDYCGSMGEPLPFDAKDVHNGWKNGDIAYETTGNYFAILYKDEEISQQFGNLVTLGRLAVEPEIMDTLAGDIRVRIEKD